MPDGELDDALSLGRGLLAWRDADPQIDRRALMTAMRDNWDQRIGRRKFGGRLVGVDGQEQRTPPGVVCGS